MFIASLSLENSFGQFQAETSNFKNVDILILKCTRWPFISISKCKQVMVSNHQKIKKKEYMQVFKKFLTYKKKIFFS